jgi:hypothetical protein
MSHCSDCGAKFGEQHDEDCICRGTRRTRITEEAHNKEMILKLIKLGGSCTECGSINGLEHGDKCSKYPIFPTKKEPAEEGEDKRIPFVTLRNIQEMNERIKNGETEGYFTRKEKSKICGCGATTPTSHTPWCPNIQPEEEITKKPVTKDKVTCPTCNAEEGKLHFAFCSAGNKRFTREEQRCQFCGSLSGLSHSPTCMAPISKYNPCVCGATTSESHINSCINNPDYHSKRNESFVTQRDIQEEREKEELSQAIKDDICGIWDKALQKSVPKETLEERENRERKERAPKEKSNKADWSIFPFSEAEEVLKAFAFGVQKYGAPFTYRQGTGVPEGDLFSATVRHLHEIQNGKITAKDSNCLHWAHIACNALMAISTLKKRQTLT